MNDLNQLVLMKEKLSEVANIASVFAGETVGTKEHVFLECVAQAVNKIIEGQYSVGDGKRYITGAFIAAECVRKTEEENEDVQP